MPGVTADLGQTTAPPYIRQSDGEPQRGVGLVGERDVDLLGQPCRPEPRAGRFGGGYESRRRRFSDPLRVVDALFRLRLLFNSIVEAVQCAVDVIATLYAYGIETVQAFR